MKGIIFYDHNYKLWTFIKYDLQNVEICTEYDTYKSDLIKWVKNNHKDLTNLEISKREVSK